MLQMVAIIQTGEENHCIILVTRRAMLVTAGSPPVKVSLYPLL
jgi:hypothetical protein